MNDSVLLLYECWLWLKKAISQPLRFYYCHQEYSKRQVQGRILKTTYRGALGDLVKLHTPSPTRAFHYRGELLAQRKVFKGAGFACMFWLGF